MNPTFELSRYHTGLSTVRAALAEVRAIYDRLDAQSAALDAAQRCAACGGCCDFETFGHRLYLTTPELLYFAHHVERPVVPMTGGVCPYRVDGRCGVYSARFAGCRIFQCKHDAAVQSELTEATLAQLKRLCERFNIPYYYADLKAALSCLEQ